MRRARSVNAAGVVGYAAAVAALGALLLLRLLRDDGASVSPVLYAMAITVPLLLGVILQRILRARRDMRRLSSYLDERFPESIVIPFRKTPSAVRRLRRFEAEGSSRWSWLSEFGAVVIDRGHVTVLEQGAATRVVTTLPGKTLLGAETTQIKSQYTTDPAIALKLEYEGRATDVTLAAIDFSGLWGRPWDAATARRVADSIAHAAAEGIAT